MRTPEELLLAVGVRKWWDSGAEDYEEFTELLIKLVEIARLEQKAKDAGIVNSFYTVMRQYTDYVPDITTAVMEGRAAHEKKWDY